MELLITSNRRKIGFAGTAPIAVPFLQKILAMFDVPVLLTKAESTKQLDSVWDFCKANPELLRKTKVLCPLKMKEVSEDLFQGLDTVIVLAYGHKIPNRLLNTTLWLNIHASILPELRGSCPINYSLINGDTRTGLTAIKMVDEIDAGDVLGCIEVQIDRQDNVSTLTHKLTSVGPEWFIDLLFQFWNNKIQFTPQDHSAATFTKMLNNQDREIDWHQPAESIYNRIRGLSPEPACKMKFKGIDLKILESEIVRTGLVKNPGDVLDVSNQLVIQAGDNAIRLTKIIPSGSRAMPDSAFLRGLR